MNGELIIHGIELSSIDNQYVGPVKPLGFGPLGDLPSYAYRGNMYRSAERAIYRIPVSECGKAVFTAVLPFKPKGVLFNGVKGRISAMVVGARVYTAVTSIHTLQVGEALRIYIEDIP